MKPELAAFSPIRSAFKPWLRTVLLACGLSAGVDAAWARGVRVRGDAIVQTHAKFSADGTYLEVSIRATDDDAAPLPRQWLEVRGAGPSAARVVDCTPGGTTFLVAPESFRVRTNADGAACIRIGSASERGNITVRFPGDALHGAAETSAAFDRRGPQRDPLSFQIVDRSLSVPLEASAGSFAARLTHADGSAPRRAGLEVRLLRGEAELARAATDPQGTLRFALGPNARRIPGVDPLRLEFAGDDDYGPSSIEFAVLVHATVRLELPAPPTQVDAGDELAFEVVVEHEEGAVDEGIVEVFSATSPVASAHVRRGTAHVHFAVEPRAPGILPLTVRYVSSSAYLRPGAPLELALTVTPRGFVSRGWFVLLVIAAAGWVFSSWRRSRTTTDPVPRLTRFTQGVHATEDPKMPGRFRGRVFDAHDGTPLPDVEVLVRHAVLDGDGVLVCQRTGADGAFAFELPTHGRDELRIETRSRTYTSESRTLPSGGTLTIALGTRRRALLERLGRWARRAGAPFDAAADATPAELRVLAGERADVARWTQAVEQAAFGRPDVDAELEGAIRKVEPK